ncbi:MAG: nitroreductase family protein [Deltaproteobacteria bacterium]|nr:nitroreductase family protein [Deltaproteobacteria bacterium]
MTDDATHPRKPEADADPQFRDRWSPRSFADEPIPDEHVRALFEAARWAPSAGNSQPWLFVFARNPEDRARFTAALNPGNQKWADRAPLLMFVLARKVSERSGKPLTHGWFDAGAAWMSLALQARTLGLYAHAMAGFDRDRAFEATGASPDDYEVIVAVAVGRCGDPAKLPDEDLREREKPSERKALAEIMREGRV